METSKLEGLTSYLVVDFLEKQGISQELSEKLQNELSTKGLFQSMIRLEGPPKKSSYQEFKSQIPTTDETILKNLIENQYKLAMQQQEIKTKKESIIVEAQQKYNIFDHKQRRKRLFDPRSRGTRNDAGANFAPEIFTENWKKFKSLFGHQKNEPDVEDPINGSPVYNLIYDKTGQYVISAADDGFVKIWSTVNGQLVNTLIGHRSDINATALSECGKYLASCSNDGIVRVWNMTDGSPVAVFKDHYGVVCSLNFFSVPQYTEEGRIMKSGLASASDDGTIKIYFEEDFSKKKNSLFNNLIEDNGGMININQKHMTLRGDGTSATKGFSSIEFHPEGYIAAGTNNGHVIVWDKIFEIDEDHIEKHRIIKSKHKQDCHLTLWNKEGNKIITASFDGSAIIWPWRTDDFLANKETVSIYEFDGEFPGKGSQTKCCAVAWSCKGRFAVASFCWSKASRRGDDESKILSNIQVYDTRENQRIHKFDKTYDGASFENYIFILEPHPFNESILLSADYDGKLIIWDIELGVMLNCFIENCAHLGYPLLNAPILDGRFSPDGLGFSVASYYGSISMYGYGDRDFFTPTPIEQFYWKEFQEFEIEADSYRVVAVEGAIDMHFIPKGPLCSSKKQIYKPILQDQPDYLDFDEQRYYEKFVQSFEAKRHSGLQDNADDVSLQCTQNLRMTIQEKIQIEMEKNLEEFYMNLAKEGKMGGMGYFIRPEKLLEMKKEEKASSLKRLTRGAGAIQAAPQTIAQTRIQPEPQELFLEESQYNPSDEEREEFLPRRRSRRRSSRRVRIDEDADFIEEEEEIQDHKDEDSEEFLFGEEEPQRERRGERRSRRLMLDEDEEEKYEEAPRRTEERWTRQRNTRAISGRRNRQLVNNTGLQQRTALNAMANTNTRTRTRIITEEAAFEEAMCSRCGLENARTKCAGGCGRAYHSGCAKKHGKEGELDIFTCLWCILRKRKGEKVYGNLNREWANEDLPTPYSYIPQAGDLVTYIFQAHEDFVSKFFEHLRFQQNEVYPFEKILALKRDNTCKITSVKYTFPFNPRRSHKGQFAILMKLEFEVVEPQEARGQVFGLTYFKSELSDFIIPKTTYVKSIALAKQQKKENQITVWHNGENKLAFFADQGPKEEGPFPDSHWCSLQLFDHSEDGGYSLRKSRREQVIIYASPWDIIYEEEDIWEVPRDKELDKDFETRVLHQFDELVSSDPQFDPFRDEVNKKIYTDYLLAVPFEMNVEKIKRRIFNMYYRHIAAIISDIELIKINCTKYNQADAPITGWSERLITHMKEIVEGTFDPAQIKNIQEEGVRTRAQKKTNQPLITHEEEKKEHPLRFKDRERDREKFEQPIVEIPFEEEDDGVRTRSSRTRRTRTLLADDEYEEKPFVQPTPTVTTRGATNPNLRRTQAPPPTEYSRRLRSTNRNLDLTDPTQLPEFGDLEDESPSLTSKTRSGGTKLKLLRKTATMRARNESLGDEYAIEDLDEEKKEKKEEKEGNGEGNYRSKLRNNKRSFTQYFEHIDDEDNPEPSEQNGNEYHDIEEEDPSNSGHEAELDDEDELKEETTKIRLITTRSRSRGSQPPNENSNSQPFPLNLSQNQNQSQNLLDDAELAARRYPSRSTRNKNPMIL